MTHQLLRGMNPRQEEAILHFDSPLLIVAGAGSGKTRVITHKIAYLIAEKNHAPFQILGVTFTNKAANEMKERIEILTNIDSRRFNISTFHSLGLRILRESGQPAGFDSQWQVIDDGDQKKVIKDIIKKNFSYYTDDMLEEVRKKINLAKMYLLYPNDPDTLVQRGFDGDEVEIFSRYYRYQKENKVWDYEDLVSLPIKLIESSDQLKSKYAEKFKYIVVDEFQDTNPNQYELLKLLAKKNKRITVVGDDDQAIYSWRGASIRYLLDFEKDFPEVKIIKLEQNYRSPPPILDFANNLIDKNAYRKGKDMWTEKKVGNPVYLLHSHSRENEAQKIALLILELKSHQRDLFPLAVLYRINSQSLAFETEFTRKNINFKIIKGQRFFDRKEIKDSLALLKLAINPRDNISFLRIIEFLPLGIGQKGVESLVQKAEQEKLPLFPTLKAFFPDKYKARGLFSKIDELHRHKEKFSPSEMLDVLLGHSGYLDFLQKRRHDTRVLNIKELQGFIEAWEQERPEETFHDLLDRMSTDSHAGEENRGKGASVYLLTMHNAKGLEFPTVIAAGINDSYMPLFLKKGRTEIEEERRLLYVASTRPIKQLIISTGSQRWSPFLQDINYGLYKTAYAAEDILTDLSPKGPPSAAPFIEETESHSRYLSHPIFGKGKIEKEIDDKRYLVHFPDKGEKVIDTSIVKVTFLEPRDTR